MNLNGGVMLNVNRIKPNLEPQEYRTFSARAPLATHWRKATCAEAECASYLNGWVTRIDLGTQLGQRQYHFITHDKERSYNEQQIDERFVEFTFPPGNRCFGKQHTISLERPNLYVVQDGDWRRYVSPEKRHTRAEFWIEEMQEHLDGWRTVQQRG